MLCGCAANSIMKIEGHTKKSVGYRIYISQAEVELK
jgi:hypothetical protein